MDTVHTIKQSAVLENGFPGVTLFGTQLKVELNKILNILTHYLYIKHINL